MSSLSSGTRRARRNKPRWSPLDSPLTKLPPDQILPFLAWCQLNNFSERTGRRIIASGGGPVVTRMSPKRIGITVGNNAKWQRSRERA
jgi:hypothetical protein